MNFFSLLLILPSLSPTPPLSPPRGGEGGAGAIIKQKHPFHESAVGARGRHRLFAPSGVRILLLDVANILSGLGFQHSKIPLSFYHFEVRRHKGSGAEPEASQLTAASASS